MFDKDLNEFTINVDKKTDYIIKTLSRTKRKDYENYIINAIWNRLNNIEIKPVTQQYVYNSIKNEHYFIDLYFPQCNIGVEIDERHHINQTHKDLNRSQAIWYEISKIDSLFAIGYQEIRIDVYNKSFEEIEKQINECVKYIKNRLNSTEIKPWIININEFVSKNYKLSLEDDILFESIVETCNHLFGTNYNKTGGSKKSFFLPKTIKEDPLFYGTKIWFPHLATEHEGVFKSVSSHWNNRLNSDGTIIEFNEKDSPIVDKEYVENITWFEHDRFVFAKSRDPLGREGYKFIGKYHKTKRIAIMHKGVYRRAELYVRISNEIPIKKSN